MLNLSLLIKRCASRIGTVQSILALVLMCVSIGTRITGAQTVEQVYPHYRHDALFGVVRMEAGQFFAAGANAALLCSTDDGGTWERTALGNHQMDFLDIVVNGTDIYLLAAAPISMGQKELWPDGYSMILFRYNTQTHGLVPVPFPLYDREQNDRLFDFRYFDLEANGGTLYLSYAGSRSRALFSRDGGVHWEDIDVPDSLGMYDLCHFYTCEDSRDILIYRPNSKMPEKKFHRSTDGGVSWNTHAGTDISLQSIVYLGDGRILAQSSATWGLLRYEANGEWKEVGFPPFNRISGVTRSKSGTIFVCSADGGVFRSDDDGDSWLLLKSELKAGWQNHYHFTCTAYGESGCIAVNTHGNILLTSDGGASWDAPRYRAEVFEDGQMVDERHGYVRVRNDDESLDYAMLTRDGFATLEEFPQYPLAFPILQTGTLWYSPSWYGGTGDTLLCVSRDGGVSWESAFRQRGLAAFPSIVESADTNVYALSTSAGLYYTGDQGENWSRILDAEWHGEDFPKNVVIPDGKAPIWMLTNGVNNASAYSIVRSDSTRRIWDTVRTIPTHLRWDETTIKGRTLGFEDLSVLTDGSIYTVYLLDIVDIARDELHVLYSNDQGASWQEWITQIPVSQHLKVGQAAGADVALLSNGGMLTNASYYLTYIEPMQFLISTDGLGSANAVLERSQVRNVDPFVSFTKATDNTAYLITGKAIYRITFPEVTSAPTAPIPPLPLSIATPYPHPVSKDAASTTLFIQSERNEHVQMTVHDLSGRELKLLFSGELAAEGRYITWTTEGLTPGTYLLQLASSEGVCRRKVVVE